MKIYTDKFQDSFYIPVSNNSCRNELSYKVNVNDSYGILSIENTIGPGPERNIYITVPSVPSVLIKQNTLYAKKGQSEEYYLELCVSNISFKAYEKGKRFYIFSSDGSYLSIYVDFIGYNGEFPLFLIEKDSLNKFLNGTLPTQNNPVQITNRCFFSTEFEIRNFLKVSTSVSVNSRQTATISLESQQGITQNLEYEFIVEPVDSPIKTIDQPPLGIKNAQTSQLSRSFIPVSSVITLQVNSEGELYMDKLYSASSNSQQGYRRRCTNLGFEKDISRFCSTLSKPSIYQLPNQDYEVSTTNLSEQYLTDFNSGVSINRETQESFRMFAPLWLKDTIPSYFAIFRRSATNNSKDLLEGASLVKMIDIQSTELGPYLNNLISNENFSKPPLEVSINQGYQLKWNGVSVETGYWVSHTEFIGVDIQDGLSDFEFNEILSSGFSRGLIVNPQLLNIEFLFDDVESGIYEINQYFGMYCDDIELSRFIPNVDSTTTLFTQKQTRSSSNSDFNSSTIINSDGVKLVVDLNDTPDRNFSVSNPSLIDFNDNLIPSRYEIEIVETSQASRTLKVSFFSETNISDILQTGTQIRLELDNGDFVKYLNVEKSSYNAQKKLMNLEFVENETYSTSINYWIRIFDLYPGGSELNQGLIKFDSSEASLSRCLVLSKQDSLGNEIQDWISAIVDQDSKFNDCLVLFDKNSSAYSILIANKVIVEDTYIKVFFDVLESDGVFNHSDEVFINVSEFDTDGAIPGPKIVNSKNRKFVIKSKDQASSIKSFSFLNYKNSIVGLMDLDSKTFDLGSIIGTKSNVNVPVKTQKDPYTGISFKFYDYVGEQSLSYGDRITIEEKTGEFSRRWSVIRSNNPSPNVTKTPGTIIEIPIVTNTLISTDLYTELEIFTNEYFPVNLDSYELINSESFQSNIPLRFVSAESLETGNYRLTFYGGKLKTDYQALRVKVSENQVTYFDYSASDSLATSVSIAIQRFVDCPLKSLVSNGILYLYSESGQSNISVGMYAPYRSIVITEINGANLKPLTVKRSEDVLSSNYYIYNLDSMSNLKVFSTEPSFSTLLSEDSKILSKSGSPLTVERWNNSQYSVPDIRSLVDESEERVLIKFSGNGEPSLLNDRLQVIDFNKVSLSLLSFYNVIDLDFFDEIPVRVQPNKNSNNTEISPGLSIRQSLAPEATILSSPFSANGTSQQKNLKLSVNIAENIYTEWRNWDPQKEPDFLDQNKRKQRGTNVVENSQFPFVWNILKSPNQFKIQYLNKDKQWVDYQISYPTVTTTTDFYISDYFLNYDYNASEMWSVDIVYGKPPVGSAGGGFDLQAVMNALISFMYQLPADEKRLRVFSEIKRLVSFAFNKLGQQNIDKTSNSGTYVYTTILPIDDDHLDYRYTTNLEQGTYSVVIESDDQSAQPESDPIELGFNGITEETSITNFATSTQSVNNKLENTSGRWKRRNTVNVDMAPYLINVDPNLLPYDMFVNATESGISKTAFSLDWYLISGWPKFYPLQEVEKTYEYIGKRISIDDLKSTTYDYFTDYLTVGYGEEVFSGGAQREKRFLWTTIEQGNTGYTTTFKGIPLVFDSKINISGSKFAAILQVEPELDKPSKISLIYNEVWKTLTLFVQINVDSYSIDGSISLQQLYDLRFNYENTESGKIYGPMMVYGSDILEFSKVNRAYNEDETVLINTPSEGDDQNEYNQYQYKNVKIIKYDNRQKDIEIFGVKYFPNVDYIVSGTVFSGSGQELKIDIVIPRSRVRGVFDPELQKERLFIDGIYSDNFFGVISDVDRTLAVTYVNYSENNVISIGGKTTFIQKAKVYAIGDWPIYLDTLNSITANSIISRMNLMDFDDILVNLNTDEAKSKIKISYLNPSVIRPTKIKEANLDEFGNVNIRERESNTNIFRLDGEFEPSYKNIVSFAASEDVSITKQVLNSFKGYNTYVLQVNPLSIWYKRVSEKGVNFGTINMNGKLLKLPYAIGRRNFSPITDVWGSDFYVMAEDEFVDVPIEGIKDPVDHKFFLASKSMSVPTFFRTNTYSCLDFSVPSNSSESAVFYSSIGTGLKIHIDFDRVISDHLFNSGVFSFFSSIWEELNTTLSPYEISKEYINRNLLYRYSVESIEVYERPFSRTEVVSIEASPESEGFKMVDSIGIQESRSFDFDIPVDGTKQILLAFNIKRR